MRSKQYAIKINQKAHDSFAAHAEEYNIPISAWLTVADAMLYKYFAKGDLPTLNAESQHKDAEPERTGPIIMPCDDDDDVYNPWNR